jgi:SanA protein
VVQATVNAQSAPTGRSGRPIRRWLRWFSLLFATVLLAAVAAHAHVLHTASPHVYTAFSVPTADCIVVPGARIHPDGQPFHLLQDRLEAALSLWRAGKARHILLSGRGGGGVGDDEVGAMRRWLAGHGVPDTAMVDDGLGLRTLDTMQRAAGTFGMRSAIVVSNPFHVARAVFLGRHCGLETYGVEAPYGRDYSTGTMVKNVGREVAARVWAWLDVFVFGVATRSRG